MLFRPPIFILCRACPSWKCHSWRLHARVVSSSYLLSMDYSVLLVSSVPSCLSVSNTSFTRPRKSVQLFIGIMWRDQLASADGCQQRCQCDSSIHQYFPRHTTWLATLNRTSSVEFQHLSKQVVFDIQLQHSNNFIHSYTTVEPRLSYPRNIFELLPLSSSHD